MDSSGPEAEPLDGGFFAARSRSGDPATEDLHARTSQPKRFNSGKSAGLRGARRVWDASSPTPVDDAAPSTALGETASHCVVRAGSVPAMVAAAVAAAEASGGRGCLCTGRVLSHGWAFMCTDKGVLAWEQGMVAAERPGAAVRADQACLQFEHPAMMHELAMMAPLGVSVEAADLVAVSQPWEARGGNREVLLVSPEGQARHWGDLHSPRRFREVDARSMVSGQSVTRVVALGPTDFLCGLSRGGVLRLRPGLHEPILLTQKTSSVLGRGFSTIRRMGSYLGQKALAGGGTAPAADPPLGDAAAAASTAAAAAASPVVALSVARPPGGSPAGIPARVVRLTTDTLEVWSVGGGGGTLCLEVRHPLASQIQRALGVRQACLLDVAVTGAPTTVSPPPASGEASASPPVVSWGLELLVLAAAGAAGGSGRDGDGGAEGGGGDGGELSVHAVRVSCGEASWVGSSVSVQVISSHHVTTTAAAAASAAGRRGRQPAFPAAAPNPSTPASQGPGCSRATLVADNEQAFSTGDGTRVGGGGGGIAAHVFWPSSNSPNVSVGGEGTATAQVWSVCVKARGGDGASGGGGGGGGEEVVEWEERGSVTVSSRAALAGGCVGGGGALLGCVGVVLLSRQGQAVWVAPRHTESPAAAAAAAGLAVDLGPCPEVVAAIPGNDTSEEWRMALVEGGLRAFEDGETMDPARLAVGSLLGRAAQETGRGAMSSTEDLDSAIVRAGLEVLNGSWRHPSAFASPHQLVHLALREKARRQRALVRVLLDAGAWGASSVGRAALSECGEKVAAASRLCELQDSISRKYVGAKAAGLLEDCVKLSLRSREATAGATAAAAAAVTSERDRYFEHTQGVLDAFVELHTPRLDEVAPSSSIDGASRTPLAKALLFDSSLEEGDRLPLLDHVSVVIAGVFEAALRHRASERSIYRSGLRGKLWTASSEARLVLFRQLLAYNGSIDGIYLQGPGAAGRGGAGGSSEGTSGVIERLSVLLLDGFKEEKDANPAASGRVEWENEYTNSKKLCVEVVAACGREDLALALADTHGYPEGTVAICHEAEGRKPGCQNGHRLLRQRMEDPRRRFEGVGQEEDEGKAADGGGVESREARAERQTFARFVLDWHLRHGYKTALLEVGEVVPDMLCEFLADWKEAELLWIFQIRRGDYTGARRALARGSPPANQKGGKCEAQHLWLSLAKLANLAGGSGDGGPNASSDPVTVDLVRGGEIQRRLELAEVREKLIKLLPANDAMDAMINGDEPWGWKDALEESTSQLNSLWQGAPAEEEEEEGGVAGVASVFRAADIAFQGYRALVAGLPEQSYLHADSLWREVIGLTLNDPHVKEAVAKGAMPSASEDRTAVSDREMEAVWKRPTALHLLLRAIQKDRRLRRGAPWAGGAGGGGGGGEEKEEEGKIDLTDESLSSTVRELMPAAADGGGAPCEAWIAAIRKCPW